MADVKVNLRVGGLSSFRSAIKQSQGAVKQMSSELRLAEARYKATGDAETYLAQRSAALKKQIEEQSKVVAECEKALQHLEQNGVRRNSEEWTSWATKLADAKTQLVSMQTQLNGASTSIGKTSDKLKTGKKSADDMKTSLKNIQAITDFSAVQKGIQGITDVVWGAIQKIGQMAVALWNAEADATRWADDLLTRSTQYGMSPEDVQRWEYASRFFDVELDSLVKASDKASSKIREAGHGVLTVWESVGGMGNVSIFDQNGRQRSSFEVTLDILRELGEVEAQMGQAQADLIAQDYFGKSYRELKPFIAALGEDGMIEDLLGSAPVVSDENVSKLGQANDALEELEATAEKTKLDALAALAPAFQTIANAFTTMLQAVDEWVQSPEGQRAIENFGTAVADMITSFTAEDFESALETAKNAIEAISNGFKWISDNHEDVANGIKIAVGAFAGLKGLETVLSIMQILKGTGGLTNLINGGGGANPVIGSGPDTIAPTGTGIGPAVGTGATGVGIKAALKAFGTKVGVVAQNAWYNIGLPAAVVGSALAPALIAGAMDEAKWTEDLQASMAEFDRLEQLATTTDQLKAARAGKSIDEILANGGYHTPIAQVSAYHDPSSTRRAFEAIAEMDLASVLSAEEMAVVQAIASGESTMDAFEETQALQNISGKLRGVASGLIAPDATERTAAAAAESLEAVEGVFESAKEIDMEQLTEFLNLMWHTKNENPDNMTAVLEQLGENLDLLSLLPDSMREKIENLADLEDREVADLFAEVYDTLEDQETYWEDEGEASGKAYVNGLLASLGAANAAGASLRAAAYAGVNGTTGLSRGGRLGATYNNNLYVNSMNVGGGLGAQGLLNMISDGQRRMNAGYGGRG